MAAFGFAELVMLLLLGGALPADVEPLPTDQLMRGLPAECEMLAVQDLRGSYDALQSLVTDLSTQGWVTGNREVAEGLTQLQGMISSAPATASAMLGINPFTDIASVSLCGKLGTSPSGEPVPSFLVVAQGTFDTTLAANMAREMGLSQMALPNGATVYGDREDGVIFGMVTPTPGLMLFGTEDMLADRAGGTLPPGWETAPETSIVGRVAALSAGGPRTVIAFQPSAGTRFLIGGEAPVTFGQLIAGLDRVALLSNSNTSYMEVTATSADGHRDFELILSGVGAYAEAAPLVTRAMANIFLGVLSPDDPELDEPLRVILSHREAILTFIEEFGLLAEPEVSFASDASSMTSTLTISNSGGMQSLSGLFVLGGMVTFMGSRAQVHGDDYGAYEVAPETEQRVYEEPAVVQPPATGP